MQARQLPQGKMSRLLLISFLLLMHPLWRCLETGKINRSLYRAKVVLERQRPQSASWCTLRTSRQVSLAVKQAMASLGRWALSNRCCKQSWDPLIAPNMLSNGLSSILLQEYHPHRNYYRPVFWFGQLIKIMYCVTGPENCPLEIN